MPKGILTFNEFVRQAYTSIFDIFALFGVPYAVLKLRLDLTDFFDTDLPFGLTMCDAWWAERQNFFTPSILTAYNFAAFLPTETYSTSLQRSKHVLKHTLNSSDW